MTNINIASIKAFESLNESSLSNIEKESELINFSMGQRLSLKDLIPEKIIIILSGRARLLHLTEAGGIRKSSTVANLQANDFIGLTSLLKGKSCEFITASTDLLGLSIPDKLILKIEAVRSHGRVWKYKGEAFVDEKKMADAMWSATIVDRNN